ncbi:SAM-dependent methyltransferase [Kibdelosporangium philippinense]|uniref:SAM-dependent methyltransferase n=1 Tax=Kibdelosporangium philippinense TaxID=211113 RepID=A0ABS8ZKN9_9PSEU|nr:SAM-dependent methyltransferase [Kibdelosporangium philippinense]MCE7007023.1 SAM-dependent methyltransferase [Kibdelosporangium philippinense]
MERPAWTLAEIELSAPSMARVYDCWLGGAHNFAVDRAVAAQALHAMPELRHVTLTHRAFLSRAVRFLLGVGVRQFLDLGSGIPTLGNVHEIAQRDHPDARVVYVDIDPVAVSLSQLILQLQGARHVGVLHADFRDPEAVLNSAEVRGLLDFDRPIGLVMTAVLHLLPDGDNPHAILRRYRDGLPSGSYQAISHASLAGDTRSAGPNQARNPYEGNVTPIFFRNRAQCASFFDGFDVVDPGVVRLPLWRPDWLQDCDKAVRFPGFGGVGRKR